MSTKEKKILLLSAVETDVKSQTRSKKLPGRIIDGGMDLKCLTKLVLNF